MAGRPPRSVLRRGQPVDLGGSAEEERLRLAAYIRFDLLALSVAVVMLSGLRIWLVHSVWLDVVIVLLGAMGAGLVVATVVVGRDRRIAAVWILAAANWAIAVAVTALVPFAFVILPIVVILPALVAVPFFDRVQLLAILVAAVAVAGALAVAGHLGPGVGLEALVPPATLDLIVIGFLPLVMGLFALSAWQTHVALLTKATALQDSRARLVSAAHHGRQEIARLLEGRTQRRLDTAADRANMAAGLVRARPQQAIDVLNTLTEELQAASAELRQVAHGVYPAQLPEQGLEVALADACVSASLPVRLRTEGLGRYPPEIETALYFCCVQAVQMVAENPMDAAALTLSLGDHNGPTFDVQCGGARDGVQAEHLHRCLVDISDRLGAVGGHTALGGTEEAGFHLRGRVPSEVVRRFRPDEGGTPSRHVHPPASVRPDAAPERQLITAVRSMVFLALSSSVVLLAVSASGRNSRLLAGVVVPAIAALLLIAVLRLAGRDRLNGSLAWLATVWWGCALTSTVLVPDVLPFTALLVVMPVVPAAAHLPQRRFQLLAAAAVVVGAAVALTGRLVPGLVPRSSADDRTMAVALIALMVVATAVSAFLIWQAHVTLLVRAEALQESRARLVATSDRERRRIERNLHDGAQQRLVAAGLQSRMAARLLSTDQPLDKVPTLLRRLEEDLRECSTELRDLALGIYPAHLAQRGLEAALRSAAARSPLPVTVSATALRRYARDIEANVYFCCLEALQNAIKHAGERASASIELDGRGGLSFDVRDTGRGCDASALQHGHGFANLQDRLSAVGGVLAVDATPGQGVRILGRIPEELLADGEPTSPLPTITAFQMSPGRRARPNTVSIIRLPEARSPRGGGPLRDLRKGGHPDADATPDA